MSKSIDHAGILALGDASRYEKVRTLTIRHPETDEPISINGAPVTIDLVAAESADGRAANHENRRRAHRRSQSETSLDYDPAFEDEAIIRQYAWCTKGWSIPNAWLKGDSDLTTAPFSREDASKLYERLPWLRRQVAAEIGKSVWAI